MEQPSAELQMTATLRSIRNQERPEYPKDADWGYELLEEHMKQNWRATAISITVPQINVVGGKPQLWAVGYNNYSEKQSHI